MTEKQRVINFFAGPGAGKSTMAARLWSELKFRGHTPEIAFEWIKGPEYEGRNTPGSLLQGSQDYIFAKQHYELRKVEHKVDWIITDSPIILGIAYSSPDYLPALKDVILQAYERYDNLNFFVKRTKEYIQVGRSQTLEQSMEKDEQIKQILVDNGIPHIDIEYSPWHAEVYAPYWMEQIGWTVNQNPYTKSLSQLCETPESLFERGFTEYGMKEYGQSQEA